MAVVFAMATMYNKTMKGAEKALIWAVVCVALAATAVAATINAQGDDAATPADANPYGAIVMRNVFGLSDAPVVNPTPTNVDLPPPNVTLIGLSTLEKVPQAIVVVKPPQVPGHPPPAEETYIMNQGERRGSLELVRINMKMGTAKIKLDGAESTLSMRTNAPMHAAAGAPGALGGAPARPTAGYTPPAAGGYTPPPAAGYTPPSQPGLASSGQGGYYSGGSPNTANPEATRGIGINGDPNGAIPARPVRTDQAPALSPEEQTLLIEAQRQDAIQRGDSMAIILPPTEMSPPGFGGADEQQGQNPNAPPGPH